MTEVAKLKESFGYGESEAIVLADELKAILLGGRNFIKEARKQSLVYYSLTSLALFTSAIDLTFLRCSSDSASSRPSTIRALPLGLILLRCMEWIFISALP